MRALTNDILMIRPANFGYNAETASNNSFQTKDDNGTSLETKKAAQVEFDQLVTELRKVGVNVLVVEDTKAPIKPDAIFPNNWLSTHENGAIVTYPMYAKNRRIERREDITEILSESFEVEKRYTFESYEAEGKYLEGTGSMIFDRRNRVVYACLSPRTNIEILDKFSILMGFKVIRFHSKDVEGNDIYHTNVMMALGEDFVIICLESIKDDIEKAILLKSFANTKMRIIDINYDQVKHFAGNMLEVFGNNEKRYTVMSKAAFDSLNSIQKEDITKTSNILYSDISTIELYGGGSVRCMLAEIYLKKRKK